MEDRIYELFATSLQDGYIGNLIEIVERAGGPQALYEMKEEHMQEKLLVTAKMVRHIVNVRESNNFESNYFRMMHRNIKFVTYKDKDYPERLRNIPSRPYGLFIKGDLPANNRKSVAIIGARECTEYGRTMAEYLADRLAREGIDIISGMAWGIDGIAQMSAVNAGGRSYGVLGCGVDVIYPKKNRMLYDELIQNGNGVISEYAPATAAISRLFPPRNRIISGLADIVIVVEARAKSGTLITVDMANEQGKTVMIVPGRITDPLSVGCLNLMKDGAIPIVSVGSVLEELSMEEECLETEYKQLELFDTEESVTLQIENYTHIELSKEERMLVDNIDFEPVSAEDISKKLGMNITQTLLLISKVQVKGIIKDLGMGYYVKNYQGC